MKRLITFLLIALFALNITATLAQRKAQPEETKQLQPLKDATIIESPKGELANSEGQRIFVGRTGQPQYSKRRGLIAFDLAGVIPPRSRILSVTLTMTSDLSAGGKQPNTGGDHPDTQGNKSDSIDLYRVLRFWKEGPSATELGRGAKAELGDATWIHSVYPDRYWARPGGDYVGVSSAKAQAPVAGSKAYTWNSTRRLVADVQMWVNSPKRNFGWILIGDETEKSKSGDSRPPNAKRFYSSESTEEALRPQLTVTFRPPR